MAIMYTLKRQEVELRGYFMRHKSGGDVGFSWDKDDPKFSDQWERIAAVPENDSERIKVLQRALAAALDQDSSAPTEEDERAAFEAHFGPKDNFAWRNADGSYKVHALQSAWEIWQAARRTPVSAPTGAERQSIDTPEFKNLLTVYGEAREGLSLADELAARSALIAHIDTWAAHRDAEAVPALYTCKGKGGAYELIGTAWPAGVLSSTLMVSSYPVYRDTKDGRLFVRTSSDFNQRMELINGAAPAPGNTAQTTLYDSMDHDQLAKLGQQQKDSK